MFLWTRRAFNSLKALTSSKQLSALVFSCLLLLAFNSVSLAQGAASPVTRSFDFRNGALGWQAGFARYTPVSYKPDDPYPPLAEIRNLPSELGIDGTGFYVQGNNHSDALVMFLKRRLSSADGIVAGQTYQVNFTVIFASAAQSGCFGAGGSPGDSVMLRDGVSPAEPLALLDTSGPFSFFGMNIDIGGQRKDGLAASASGTIANGIPCSSASPSYVSIQQTHQHTSLVNANSKGDLWLFVGTDSGFEGPTGIYYQRIDVSLTPVTSPPAPILLAKQTRGPAS